MSVLLERYITRNVRSDKRNQSDSKLSIVVFRRRKRLVNTDLDVELFTDFSRDAVSGHFAWFYFPTRKFPLQWKAHRGAALSNQDAVIFDDDGAGDLEHNPTLTTGR